MNKLNIISCFIILLLVSCLNKKQDKKINNFHKADRTESQKAMIIGKQLKSLNEIVGDSIALKDRVIFIYNGFDCETCIDIGYAIIKKIDSLSQVQMAYVIATSTNVGRDQERNSYYNYVYFDEHDVIRRELKYILTPVIIRLDTLNKIKNVYFPTPNRDFEMELKFIYGCIIKQ
jgi:hypothetical protein